MVPGLSLRAILPSHGKDVTEADTHSVNTRCQPLCRAHGGFISFEVDNVYSRVINTEAKVQRVDELPAQSAAGEWGKLGFLPTQSDLPAGEDGFLRGK